MTEFIIRAIMALIEGLAKETGKSVEEIKQSIISELKATDAAEAAAEARERAEVEG